MAGAGFTTPTNEKDRPDLSALSKALHKEREQVVQTARHSTLASPKRALENVKRIWQKALASPGKSSGRTASLTGTRFAAREK